MPTRGYRYDRFHLDDSMLNRSLVTRYLKGLVTFHLVSMEIIMNRNIFLQTAENLVGPDMDLQLRYVHTTPNLLQFRRAFEATWRVPTWRSTESSNLQLQLRTAMPRTRRSLHGLRLHRKRRIQKPQGRVRRKMNCSARLSSLEKVSVSFHRKRSS